MQGPVPLESREAGTFTLGPAGPAGTYDVTLRGQRDTEDLVVAFTWTTSSDGPLPRPEARVSVLAANRGEVDTYGGELSVRDLAETPAEAAQASQGEGVRGLHGTKLVGSSARGEACGWTSPREPGPARTRRR